MKTTKMVAMKTTKTHPKDKTNREPPARPTLVPASGERVSVAHSAARDPPSQTLLHLATLPRAVILFRRRELEKAARLRKKPNPGSDRTLDLLFARAIYPATMGPDEAVDRLGYGETISELRVSNPPDEREMLRTRSGTLLVGPEQDLQPK
jgi:hypothetical protein